MVDLAALQAVSYIMGSLGVFVAAVYYIISLRYNIRAKEMEICRYFTSDITSDQGIQRYAIMMTFDWKDHEDFMEKYGYSNPEMFGKWISQFFMYEALGVLIKNKIVKAEILYTLGAYGAIRAWEKYKNVIQERRGIAWGMDYMINAEYVAQEMMKIKTRNDANFKDKLETYKKTRKL